MQLMNILQGATFVYEAILAPVVGIVRREIAKNPSLDRTFNREFAQDGHVGLLTFPAPSQLALASLSHHRHHHLKSMTFAWKGSAQAFGQTPS